MSEPKRYRKKPVVVEAFRFDGTRDSLPDEDVTGYVDFDPDAAVLRIDTLEGTMVANPWDFVIKGVNGELYPCKPDIFEKTYDPVDESDSVSDLIRDVEYAVRKYGAHSEEAAETLRGLRRPRPAR